MDPLNNAVVVAAICRAWLESDAEDSQFRLEEGGYIVLEHDLTYHVERWPRGAQARITPPPLDQNNCYNGEKVVATFHTHPNPPVDEFGREWEQGPSGSDRRWHQRRGLRGFVVGRTLVYEIDLKADVHVLGRRDEVLSP